MDNIKKETVGKYNMLDDPYLMATCYFDAYEQ